jgi:2-oxoglutarate ferredoxin oxidoreductase subunit delta
LSFTVRREVGSIMPRPREGVARCAGASGHFDNVGNAKDVKMAGKIVIDMERCKGCGLCITVCPRKSIALAPESNKSGYFPAQAGDSECTACTRCAVICPEGIIEVLLEEPEKIRIVATAVKKDTSHLIEEKR